MTDKPDDRTHVLVERRQLVLSRQQYEMFAREWGEENLPGLAANAGFDGIECLD